MTSINPQPQQGWVTTDGGKSFAAPVPPTPSAEQVAATNTAMRDSLMQVANNATFGMTDTYAAGLLDTADRQTFKAWAAYKLALSKVDLTTVSPSWPRSQ
ncbi:tail fiber assembly protein [Paraburkholderia silviterrae]|uniref:tail fiber assembly protein n=1 Tax=Paraburkholderia silviterrae TaxID=2528715 RepID=UPI0014050323|nr:tail fiber assembly protein [Paraburkholderia silviterrae]